MSLSDGWRAVTEKEQITSDQGKKLRVVGEPDYHQRWEDNLAMIQLHALITYILHAQWRDADQVWGKTPNSQTPPWGRPFLSGGSGEKNKTVSKKQKESEIPSHDNAGTSLYEFMGVCMRWEAAVEGVIMQWWLWLSTNVYLWGKERE